MRIARALAMAGIDSRRKCEVFVQKGEVTVNGEVVFDLGRQVHPDQDEICLRGRPTRFEKFVYYVVNKPAGYTTTAQDPHAKKTVYDLLPRTLVPRTGKPMPSRTRVFPVGRLDKNSTGILLFTNDGELADHLTHPRYGVGKWYEVRLNRALDPKDFHRLLKGVSLEGELVKAEKIQGISRRRLRVLIREGKKREIRRMFDALGYEVLELCRIAFGPILLGTMPVGNGRFLHPPEVNLLKKLILK